MPKRPCSPNPSDSSDAFPPQKVVVMGASREVSALQAQIDQLIQEKSDLMLHSFSELKQHEDKNRALDEKVQQLMNQIAELNEEADDLMNHENDALKAAEDKRDELYKELVQSNVEVCKLQRRVGILQQELESRKSIDRAGIQLLDRGKDTRGRIMDNQKVLRDASTQTDRGGIVNMLTTPVVQVVNPVDENATVSKREKSTIPDMIDPAIQIPRQVVNPVDETTVTLKKEEMTPPLFFRTPRMRQRSGSNKLSHT
ncbi:hypothetical protein BT96DRAFT_1009844 [Gymnopus androsaceus JB14]|uniref:Uncharacterized protein n=1 Tax=Gymnopus androsaceus JB14 TaxID=1447944 RepID=A0A6A4GBT1_9AGAR|nr:hypothetical protein BT96DRAFT_1009844 [Gymnopus androsaceus JB14]